MFKCKWFNLGDTRKGMHIEGKLTSVNVNKFWYESDPFILVCQAKQLFYLNERNLAYDQIRICLIDIQKSFTIHQLFIV